MRNTKFNHIKSISMYIYLFVKHLRQLSCLCLINLEFLKINQNKIEINIHLGHQRCE